MRFVSHRLSIHRIALSICFLCVAPQLQAQSPGRLEVGANYDWTRANAPAGQCVCFSLNGGTGNIAYGLPHAFSVVAELGGGHANNLGGTTQSVTIYTYLAGARYRLPVGQRADVYAEVLLGATHEASNYTYVANSNAFTVGGGGGLHIAAGQRFGFNAVQLDWLHSDLPNGSNNRQNDLRIGTGVYVRWRLK